jgi:hypothetical protein
MNDILDILKYTIPALIVFLTVYYLFKGFLQQQYQMEALKVRQNQSRDILPIKLQAYERLMMFCERISIDQLVYRLIHPDMGPQEVRNACLVAIQQEYEHNLSQQVYVSGNLWKIIDLAKNQMQVVISDTEGATVSEWLTHVKRKLGENGPDPVQYAKSAIREEAQLLIQ